MYGRNEESGPLVINDLDSGLLNTRPSDLQAQLEATNTRACWLYKASAAARAAGNLDQAQTYHDRARSAEDAANRIEDAIYLQRWGR